MRQRHAERAHHFANRRRLVEGGDQDSDVDMADRRGDLLPDGVQGGFGRRKTLVDVRVGVDGHVAPVFQIGPR
jgi:hypothetical protein